MQQILLTGSTGMIGRNMKDIMPPMLCPTHAELDLTDSAQVKEYLRANKPEAIIHCGSNDDDICLYDNLRMFLNLAESGIPMLTFCTGREVEDRSYKNGEYVLSKHVTKELALSRYSHITVIQIWGCFGKYERPIRFFADNIQRIKDGLPIIVRGNKLFSYVYVNDLIAIIGKLPLSVGKRLIQIVGYTHSLLDYAKVLKRVSGSPHDILIESENFYHSYTGRDTSGYTFTPLENAIKDMLERTNDKIMPV